MKIKATNHYTGEVIELAADTPEQIVTVWRVAQDLEKVAKSLKDQAKKLVPEIVGPNGLSEPIANYQFRVNSIQRMNYNKATLRETLDADLFDVFLEPNKPAIDRYIKENLATLGPISSVLRDSMVPVGEPYQVIKLEKL